MNKSFFYNVCIGAVVMFITSSAIVGLQQTYQFTALSIICTMGISLVVWLPLSYLVGICTQSLLYPILVALLPEKFRNKQVTINTPISADQQAIESYIRQCSARSITKEVIVQQLLQAGWKVDQVNQAFTRIK